MTDTVFTETLTATQVEEIRTVLGMVADKALARLGVAVEFDAKTKGMSFHEIIDEFLEVVDVDPTAFDWSEAEAIEFASNVEEDVVYLWSPSGQETLLANCRQFRASGH